MKSRYLVLVFCFIFSCKDKEVSDNKSVESSPVQKIDSIIKTIQPRIENAFLLGKFDYKAHDSFVKVESKFSSKTIYLQTEVIKAFEKMHEAAKQDGVNLVIVSGTRNFEEQKRIWNRKWNKYNTLQPIERIKKIMEYSSMPSTSRHHWGTDMDLNNLNNSYFTKGEGKKIYDWLVANANDFGFYQVYTNTSNGRTGYNLERWHWSYLPLAANYLNSYNSTVTYSDINNFEGSIFAEELDIISEYVNGVSIKVKTFKKL